MRLGCCANMLAGEGDPTGARWIPLLAELGYDYVELPLAQAMDLDEGEFEELLNTLAGSGIPCECCNNFFPGSVRITGPEADEGLVRDYMERALDRAQRLGAEIVVFGSAGAKNVPPGFNPEKAYRQVVGTLKEAGALAGERGVTIAIEPLNRKESNLILNVREGYGLMEAVDHPQVRLLVDYYHSALEKDTEEDLRRYAHGIVHTHFAHPQGRTFPRELLPVYETFFRILREEGYNGRASAEAFSQDPAEDLGRFVRLFR